MYKQYAEKEWEKYVDRDNSNCDMKWDNVGLREKERVVYFTEILLCWISFEKVTETLFI